MTKDEREEAIKVIENFPVESTEERRAVLTAIKALETLEEFEKAKIITGGRLNGRTYAYKCGLEDGKRKALEQEPCEMTAEEYRQRMIQAFHNADTDELIAVCVLPTEKEFEYLEWLLKNHYKKEPCEDAISRQAVLDLIEHYNSDGLGSVFYGYEEGVKFADKVKKLPPITSQEPCEDAISREDALMCLTGEIKDTDTVETVIARFVRRIKKLSSVIPQGSCEDAISRILKTMWNCRGKHTTSIDKVKMEQIIRDELSSVTPQPKTIQEKQAESEKYDKAFDDGYENGYAQARFDYEQEPKTGQWIRMSDLSEQEDDRYKCSHCGNVVHHKNKINLYTFNSWCGRCGSNNGKIEVDI